MKRIYVNGREYVILRLLGKGKGGYSHLAMDGDQPVVIRRVHHEPCDYYQFGNKIEAEVRDYRRLSGIGITLPKMIDVDIQREQIVKEYIDGKTVFEMVLNDELPLYCIDQVREMCSLLYPANTNIDFFPTNFVLQNRILYYIDYGCNDYISAWDFEHWGIKFWSKTPEFLRYVQNHRQP